MNKQAKLLNSSVVYEGFIGTKQIFSRFISFNYFSYEIYIFAIYLIIVYLHDPILISKPEEADTNINISEFFENYLFNNKITKRSLNDVSKIIKIITKLHYLPGLFQQKD